MLLALPSMLLICIFTIGITMAQGTSSFDRHATVDHPARSYIDDVVSKVYPGHTAKETYNNPTVQYNLTTPRFHVFTIYNNASETIWIATLSNPGFSTIARGGFVMAPWGPPVDLLIPVGWQGRVWARNACNFNSSGTCTPAYQPCCASGSCLQADRTFGLYCADSGVSPTSLIEMTMDANSPYGPYDDYDISFVDGWSVPLSMVPTPGTYNVDPDPGVTAPWCEFAGCYAAPACPAPFTVNTSLISCWSPCEAAVRANKSVHDVTKACCVCTEDTPSCDCTSTNDPTSPQYGCCSGGFGCTPYHDPPYSNDVVCDPWSQDPSRGWTSTQLAYINNIKQACNMVYSWQFDDHAASFQCRMTGGLVDYKLSFVTVLR